MKLKAILNTLPKSPGVYIMKNSKQEIIYIGKAKSLRSRVRSYFQEGGNYSARIKRLISCVDDIEVILTKGEIEALVLESNLIKKNKPRFNVILRDDKHYPYLKITTEEDFPRLIVVRRVKKDGGLYFGPYPSGKSVSYIKKLVQNVFKLRQSKDKLTGNEKKRRPCLNYQIGLCHAPCAKQISKDNYQKIVKKVELFLKGRDSKLIEGLKKSMEKASINMKFEEAARIRDQIRLIEKFMEKQTVITVGFEDRDVIAVELKKNIAVVQILFVRGGKLIGTRYSCINKVDDIDKPEILSTFISQYYSSSVFIPKELIIDTKITGIENISIWLSKLGGKKVKVITPKSGIKKELIRIAKENAVSSLNLELNVEKKVNLALVDLAEILGMDKTPARIEAFDISGISGGSTAVGTMVVFLKGKQATNEYRRYKIKSVAGMNDYAMMGEILTRRYKNNINTEEGLPDLLIVDGGKGQIGVGKTILDGLSIKGIKIVGIAKGKDRNNSITDKIYTEATGAPLILDKNSPGKKLIQSIRDEAHRFSIMYHRKLRNKESLSSYLDSIDGVGAKRKKKLLSHFGSVQMVKKASIDEIMKTIGVGEELANRILNS